MWCPMTRVSELFRNPVNNRGLKGEYAFNCECLKEGCAWWNGEGCGVLTKPVVVPEFPTEMKVSNLEDMNIIVKSMFEEEEVPDE